mgnify:CR=1 FL=1
MSDMAETATTLSPTPETGLTEAEASARREQGLGNAAAGTSTRSYWAIVRENVFTFINNVLFLLGALLVIVGRPFDAFVSLLVIGTNIAVGVYQEAVSYTHLTLPTKEDECRSRWSRYH